MLKGIGWAILLWGCQSGEPTKTTIFNPNGDSELALLMREMYDDGLLTKQQLIEGKKPTIRVEYHQLHTAEATEPEKVASPLYSTFATSYEAAVQSLLESNEARPVESYQHMIQACIQCHQEVCPGPVRKIKKLYLSDSEIAFLTDKE